ncbi:MAG: hypothetical protein O2905_08750, partial [Proteobacteria bacterium]|nr:hypothetical protein [Pseudomonadota bacterium]
AAASAIAGATGRAVRANFTDAALGRAAADAVATEAGPPYYRFLRSRVLDCGAAPQTTWLDRI